MNAAARPAAQLLYPSHQLDAAIHESQRLRHEIEVLIERARIWKVQRLIRERVTQHDPWYGSDLTN